MNNVGFYTLGDHLGSTSITVDESGTVVAELRYKAWGETRYAAGDTPTTWRYTGQRQEEGLELYYYGARWYDPALGRFIQSDTRIPLPGNPQSYDRYAYVFNNPLKYTDPDGHFLFIPFLIVGIVGGMLGGAAYGYGHQVVDNLNEGKDLGEALTTDIDPLEVGLFTGTGGVIGAPLGIGAGVIYDAVALAGPASEGLRRGAERLCEDGDCKDEIEQAIDGSQRAIQWTARQIQKVFGKHGEPFGVTENYNPEAAERFGQTLQEWVRGDSIEEIVGTYRTQIEAIHYFEEATGRVVTVDRLGNLITAVKLKPWQILELLEMGNWH